MLNNSTSTLVFPLFSERKDYDFDVTTFLSLKVLKVFKVCTL